MVTFTSGKPVLQTHGWSKSRSHVLLVGNLLRVIYTANEDKADPVPYTAFQNEAVSNAVQQSLQVEWVAWQKVKQVLAKFGSVDPHPSSLCQLPFLMSPECKKIIMQGEAMLMQNHEARTCGHENVPWSAFVHRQCCCCVTGRC